MWEGSKHLMRLAIGVPASNAYHHPLPESSHQLASAGCRLSCHHAGSGWQKWVRHWVARRERHDARAGGRREGLGDAEDAAAAAAQLLPLVAAEAAVHALRHIARQLDVLLLVLACAGMVRPWKLKACMTAKHQTSCIGSSASCLSKTCC